MENNKQTKKCKHCQTDIPFGSKKCPHCQSDLRNWFMRHKIITVILVLIFGSIILSNIGSYIDEAEKSQNGVGTSNNTDVNSVSSKGDNLHVGDLGYIKINNGSLLVSPNKSDAEEVIKLSVAKDNLGVAKMVVDGRTMLVDSETQIRVIDTDWLYTNVRIMEGKYYGESGWLPNEFVFRNK